MPLDFSHISRAPHECQYELWERHAPIFYGDDPIEFIVEFLIFVLWHNIAYEDVLVTIFAQSWEKGARPWYHDLPPGSISSFHDFLITFKEAWAKDEDKDLIGNPIDAMLWVELRKYTSLIIKLKQQKHEVDLSRCPRDEVETHEDAMLYWTTYAWKKCHLLGLDDQKEVLDAISEELGFESGQSDDEDPNEEPLLQETQKEFHDEAFEGRALGQVT